MDALDREMQEMAAEPISARLDRRRRGLETEVLGYEQLGSTSTPTAPQGPSAIMRARRRATAPSERLRRHRDRLSQTAMARHVAEPSRPPPALPSVPRIGSPDITTREYSGEAQVNRENRARAKRRKLDHDGDGLPRMARVHKYGYKGSVVTGPLRMEILENDGGNHECSNQTWYDTPETTALFDTNGVYRTKGNRCNMILAHYGKTPFTLSKMVIKTPRKDFNAPVQEGMIFVAMENDEKLARISRYVVPYVPRKHRLYRPRPEQSQIRLAPSHEYYASLRPPLRSLEHTPRQAEFADRHGFNISTIPPAYAESLVSEPRAIRHSESEPPQATVLMTPTLVPGFRVSLRFDEDSPDRAERDDWTRGILDEMGGRQNGLRGDPLPEQRPDMSEESIRRDQDHTDHYRRDGTDDDYDDDYEDEDDDEDDPHEAVPDEFSAGSSSNDSHFDDEDDNSDAEELRRLIHSTDPSLRHLSPAELQTRNDAYMRRFRQWRSSRRQARDWHYQGPPARTTYTREAPTTKDDSEKPDILTPHARFFIRGDKTRLEIEFDPPV